MVDNYVHLYKELAKLPSVVKAFGNIRSNKVIEIVTTWEQRDVVRMAKTPFKKSYLCDLVNTSKYTVSSPVEIHNEQLSSTSDLGLVAIVRKCMVKNGNEKQLIEIWKNGFKIKSIDVLSKEKHLNIITSGQFGCLSWSPSGKRLLYAAEKYVKSESYFSASKPASNDQQSSSKIQKGEEFLYRQSWGETLQDVISPLLATVDIETEEVEIVPSQSEDISYGKGRWTPDGNGVVCVGWPHTPFKLGLIYCGNRKSSIYHLDLENNTSTVIGSSNHSVNEGFWFSPNGKTLVFLQSDIGGAHRSSQSLIKVNWSTKDVTEVVKIALEPDSKSNFPGIYSLGLPDRIWLDDNEHVILHSIWRSKQELLCINVNTSKITKLTNDEKFGEYVLLDCFDKYIVSSKSAPNLLPILEIGTLISTSGTVLAQWEILNSFDYDQPSIDWRILQLKPPSDAVNHKYPNLDYEAILLTPRDSSKQPYPLVVIPHGGPHSTICAFYGLSADFFCRLGCAVLYINYRGSLGFGQNNVDSLLGNIGVQDVKDCQNAVDVVLDIAPIDKNNISISSGSHGGYLALSLIGLYPDKYKSCVARNPVVSVHDMVCISDIPDWCFAESGFPYDFTSTTNSNVLTKMWELSPIRLVDQIKTPVLFTLGNGDLRVPFNQGLLMHRALKARNVKTKVYMYNDCHALSHVDTESDCLIHIAQWILGPNTEA
ncbi:hypothetical protein CHUAL_013356 [Chamberlinius hualienensis]